MTLAIVSQCKLEPQGSKHKLSKVQAWKEKKV